MTETHLQQILDVLDIESLEKEEQEAVRAELDDAIMQGTVLRLFDSMDESTRDEYMDLVEGGAEPAEIDEFLRTKVPGAEEAQSQTIAELADDILIGANSIT